MMNRHGKKSTRSFTENCGDSRDDCGKKQSTEGQAVGADTVQADVVQGSSQQATLLHLREATRLLGRGIVAYWEIRRPKRGR
jgi:hypothetical protein